MRTHKATALAFLMAATTSIAVQPAGGAWRIERSPVSVERGAGPSAGGCTVRGTPGDDVLVGTPRSDVICGFAGRDRVFGLGGADIIRGGPGRDQPVGGPGTDRLKGGSDADLMRGGSGNDRIEGGRGRDELHGGPGRDEIDAADGVAGDLLRGESGSDRCTADDGDDASGCERGDAATPPPAPTGLDGVATSSRVDLIWNEAPRAERYRVIRDGVAIATVKRTSYSDATVAANTAYTYAVRGLNDGGASASSAPFAITTEPAASQTFVVMAAGDIACDPANASYNSGNGTATKCRHKHTAGLLAGADRVLTLGDQQYECGGLSAFNESYDPSWGDVKPITHPILADEEYGANGTGCGAAGPDGYMAYFANQLAPHQASASDPDRGYYSFDIGPWHVIALNTECSRITGGCAQGGPQNDWLESDLASSSASCTIALMHQPRFASRSSGAGPIGSLRPIWQDLHAHGVEMVLSGDQHFYERFAPQDPDGNPEGSGIRQFVVGTGGKSHGGLASPDLRAPNSVTAVGSTFGVLRLVLRDGSYDWRFLVEGSSPYDDSGSASCQ